MITKRSDLIVFMVRDENMLCRLLEEKEVFWIEYIQLLIDQKDLTEGARQWKCPSESLILREIEDEKEFEVFWKKKQYIIVKGDKVIIKKGSDF